MQSTLNIALIGAGTIGRMHASHISRAVPGANLVAVADVVEAAAQRCAEQHGLARWSTDYHEIVADPAVDAVVICTLVDTHADIVAAAAKAGKHVFCEKPLARTLVEVDRALAEVDKAGVKFQIGFQRRFDANFMRAKQAIESGEIGTPHLIHIISRDPKPEKSSHGFGAGGIFYDMTVHDFDMARYLGGEVDEVYTLADSLYTRKARGVEDLDSCVMTLRFASGAFGTIDNYCNAAWGYDQRVEVVGTLGAVSVDNNYRNSAVISSSRAIQRDLPLHYFLERYVDAYRLEMQTFVDIVLHDKPVPVTAHDARMAAAIGMAARESYEQHRPVQLSEVLGARAL